MSAAPADRLLGALIDGRYRVDREVGTGGFGTVYEAFHLGLGAKVAVKVLALPEQGEPALLAQRTGALVEEARTLKRLHHPNIAAALDVGLLPEDEHGARLPYFVMEWCDGPTLKQLLDLRGGRPMPLAEAWQLFAPLLDAVGHAHEEGVVHRDLKPGNVILEAQEDGSRRPRVIDFGIAKIVSPDDAAGTGATQTGSGASPFTPRYAAPEQLAGARTGPWTDVHALALVFVELCTGRPAIDDGDALGAVDPVRPTPGARGVDVGALEPVLLRALSLRPADRHADASALAVAMRAAIAPGARALPALAEARTLPVPSRAGEDGTHPPSSRTLRNTLDELRVDPSPRPPARRPRRRPILAVVALATVAALGLGATVGRRLVAGRSPSRGPFRDVPEAELDRRILALGLGTCTPMKSPFVLAYGCAKGTVMAMDTSMFGSKEDGYRQVNDMALMYAPTWGAARYAIDGPRAVIVATRPEGVDATLDAVLGGATVELRAGAEREKAPALSAAARIALADWKGTDLWAAAALVNDQVMGVRASSEPATATILEGSKAGILQLHTQNGRRVLDAMKNPPGTRFAYAIDGDTLLVIMGDPRFASADFARELLGGARAAEVGATAPPP